MTCRSWLCGVCVCVGRGWVKLVHYSSKHCGWWWEGKVEVPGKRGESGHDHTRQEDWKQG